jgi:hypothetical protein
MIGFINPVFGESTSLIKLPDASYQSHIRWRAVVEARFGIPEDIVLEAWTRLPVGMRVVLNQLYQLHHQLG